MFTEINHSGVKDSRFNEQLLLAALKMLWVGQRGRQTEGEKKSANTQDIEPYSGTMSKNQESSL